MLSGRCYARSRIPRFRVLTLTDLGIIRWVRSSDDETVVGVAPTYSGCPATEVIEASVIDALRYQGYANRSGRTPYCRRRGRRTGSARMAAKS